jgi:hypothetical protein
VAASLVVSAAVLTLTTKSRSKHPDQQFFRKGLFSPFFIWLWIHLVCLLKIARYSAYVSKMMTEIIQ